MSFDPDGTIESYVWDFGDFRGGNGQTPTHVYASENSYSVTLTVTDNHGLTGTKTVLVTVIAYDNSYSGCRRTDLSSIGEAWDVNAQGQVVGALGPDFDSAFLVNPVDTNGDGTPDSWFVNNGVGGNSLLQTLGLMTPVGWSEADAINSFGQIAGGGLYQVSPGVYQDIAYLLTPEDIDADGSLEWFKDGGSGVNLLMEPVLGPTGSTTTWCWSMNENGNPMIVGECRTASGPFNACVWSDATGWVTLGTLGGAQSLATSINDNGVVIGWAQTQSGQQHAFVIEPESIGASYVWWKDVGGDGINDLMIDLGAIGGTVCVAQSINNVPTVVGYGLDNTGHCHALKWEKASGIWQLTNLTALVPSWVGGAAYAINDNGDIGGMRNTVLGNQGERYGLPVVYDDLGLHDLETTGSGIVWGVSATGIVVGGMNGLPSVWTPESATPIVATSLSATTIMLGESVTDTVTVTGPDALSPTPTGTVQFQVKVGNGSWTNHGPPVSLVNGSATSDPYTPLGVGPMYYHFKAC
jgi:probable HAF family extracellular repeat protein